MKEFTELEKAEFWFIGWTKFLAEKADGTWMFKSRRFRDKVVKKWQKSDDRFLKHVKYETYS